MFPSLANVDGGYPEAVQQIAAKLAGPEGREAVLGDYLAFREAYKADRSALRFHYHDVDGIFVSLAAQLLERRKFTSDMERVPVVNSFITQDEIGAVSYTHLDVYKRQLYRCDGRLVPYADKRFRGMFTVKERRTLVTPKGKQALHEFIGMLTSDEKAAV